MTKTTARRFRCRKSARRNARHAVPMDRNGRARRNAGALLVLALLGLSAAAQAERYTIPWFVNAGIGGAPQGVLRVLNGTEEAGSAEIVAIDDTGVRTGPVTLELNPWTAVEFTALELQYGNVAKGLPVGLGSLARDVRLLIDSDVAIVPSAYVHSGDGALAALHDTVLEQRNATSDTYAYDVPILRPAANAAQQSLLRLINPGDEAARIMIGARDDAGMPASGGTVELTLPGGAARTLTAQQLEAGDNATLTGWLGAGVGNWRLSVVADRPIRALHVTAGYGGDWSNLSTTALSGWAPADEAAFESRFRDRVIVRRDGMERLELAVLAEGRFRGTGLTGGARASDEGDYRYERIGRDAGLLTLAYDSGLRCTASLYFESPASGRNASGCVDAADAVVAWDVGSWWALEAGAAPLDLGTAPEDMTYTVGTAIDAVTLPEATGGAGDLTYSLSPEVPGLQFDASTRELTGTPSEAGTWSMTYRVRDASGDSDWRSFTVTVSGGTTDDTTGGTTYEPLEGLRVSPGLVQYGIFAIAACFNLPANLTFNGVTLTLHSSWWQRRDNADSPWEDVPDTVQEGGLCAHNPTESGEYRLVGDITVDGTRGNYSSENTFTVD